MFTTALLVIGLTVGQLPAEKPPQPAPAPAPKPAAPAAPRQPAVRPSITVVVTDRQGNVLPDVVVKSTGAMEREGKTDAEGIVVLRNVGPGTYRLRFESATTVAFEREVTVAVGRPVKTTAELTVAAPPPPPPPARSEPVPAPATTPPPPPSGPPSSLNVIPILEKGAKNASIACTGSATATLVDLKEPIAQHSHNDADELIYVVAGEGTQRIGNVETRLDAGTLAAVPRGTPHNIARRGSRQFVYISILTGPPCTSPAK